MDFVVSRGFRSPCLGGGRSGVRQMGLSSGHSVPTQGPSARRLRSTCKMGFAHSLHHLLAVGWPGPRASASQSVKWKGPIGSAVPGPGTGWTVHRLPLRSLSPSCSPRPAPPCALALAGKLGHPPPSPPFCPWARWTLVWLVTGIVSSLIPGPGEQRLGLR